jgi:hypothetical protein
MDKGELTTICSSNAQTLPARTTSSPGICAHFPNFWKTAKILVVVAPRQQCLQPLFPPTSGAGGISFAGFSSKKPFGFSRKPM